MTRYDSPVSSETDTQSHWALRLAIWLVDRLRPDLGWLTLLCSLALALMPVMTLTSNRWLRTDVASNGLFVSIVAELRTFQYTPAPPPVLIT